MGIILDIIIIAFFALSIFMGYKKGLVKVCVKLCAFVISIILALILYKPVSDYVIKNSEIDDNIKKSISQNFEIKQDEVIDLETNSFGKYLQKYVDTGVESANNTIDEYAQIIAVKVINIGVIIAIFIVARLALIALTLVSDIITELPLIKQCNELGGAIYGILRGIIIIFVVLAILFFITSINGNTSVDSIIDSSFITKFLYTHNILLDIIF